MTATQPRIQQTEPDWNKSVKEGKSWQASSLLGSFPTGNESESAFVITVCHGKRGS